MKAAKLFISIVSVLLLQACVQTAPPKATSISGQEFKIIVPKKVDTFAAQAWGINFLPFNNSKYKSKGIQNFYRVDYSVNNVLKQMETKACKGEYFSGSRRSFQSCIAYMLGHAVIEKEDYFEITLKPKQRIETQGKSPLFIPMPFPDADLNSLYGWLSSQQVTFSGKIVSDYPSESVKGNFDRLLANHTWGKKADAAHRQFRDSYYISIGDDIRVIISASFYPYKNNGTMVEYLIDARSENNPSVRERDWKEVIEKAIKRIESVAKS